MEDKFIQKVADFQRVKKKQIIEDLKETDFSIKLFDGFVIDTYKQNIIDLLPKDGTSISIALDPIDKSGNTDNIRIIHTSLGWKNGHRNIFYTFDSTKSDPASIGAFAKGTFYYKNQAGKYVSSTFDQLHNLKNSGEIAFSGMTSDGGPFCLSNGFEGIVL
jgi:hypothetical protein